MAANKNQRAGKRSINKPNLCPKGHERTWVNIAKRGRKNMQPLCECDDFTPITK